MTRTRPDVGAEQTIEWFRMLLALLATALLAVVYILWTPDPTNRVGQLIVQAIPSAVVVLAAIVVVYFVFYRPGLTSRDPHGASDPGEFAARIAAHLSSAKAEPEHPQLRSFFDTYRAVHWDHLLGAGRTSLDIVVYYFDSWVNQNYDAIVSFFRKPGSRVRVFVSDPDDEFILANVTRLFPEYSTDVVREKIARTGQRLLQALQEAGGDPHRLEFYYVPHLLNYSVQCIDEETLVLSIFEMFRKNKIDSPAVVIDLRQSDHLTQFWRKELQGLLAASRKVKVE